MQAFAGPIDPAAYGISPTTGFVPETDPIDRLPEAFAPWEHVIERLPALIMHRQVRRWIADLPELDSALLTTAREQERGLMLLTSLAMAHVWAGASPDFDLPRNIAVPLIALTRRMDRPPIVHHATLVIHNWRRLDTAKPVALDNIDTQFTFTGGFDEKWFYLATVGVELAAAPMIAALADAANRSADATDPELAQRLNDVALGIETMSAALMRMRDRCDPHIFYNRIRTFLAGWPAPGLLYSGAEETRQVWSGGSAAQSALLQSIDAALDIRHEKAVTRTFLDDMLRYMPPQHRGFVAALRARSLVRERALRHPGIVQDAYNACIAATDHFRRKHIGITADYILKQADVVVGPGTTGTGGTDFVEFLRESRIETARSELK